MATLKYLKDILNVYRDSLKNCTSKEREKVHNDFIYNLNKLRDRFPDLLYPLYDENISKDDANKVIEGIRNRVQFNFKPIIPSYNYINIDLIGDNIIVTPELYLSCCKNEIHDEEEDDEDSCADNEEEDEYCCNEEEFNNDYMDYWGNFISDDNSDDDMEENLLRIFLSLPIEKIKLYIVDLSVNSISEEYVKLMRLINKIGIKLDDNSFIRTKEQMELFLNKTSGIIENRLVKYEDYIEYCEEHQNIPEPYIFVLICDGKDIWTDKYKFCREKYNELSAVLSSGVFFIDGISTDIKVKDTNNYPRYEIICNKHGNNAFIFSPNKVDFTPKYVKDVINTSGIDLSILGAEKKLPTRIKTVHSEVEAKKIKRNLERLGLNISINGVFDNSVNKTPIVKCTKIVDNPNLFEACIDYINYEVTAEERKLQKAMEAEAKANAEAEAKKKAESEAKAKAAEEYMQKHYIQDFETIVVPIGNNSSNMVVNFSMDSTSHVHSFIIGQSGSGKSVFLHNVIASVIYKYAPEDIQLYLFDFKLGGVEFNRYKGVKHVKSLLVDNSDQQITLEILRELRDVMVERGRKLRDVGVNNLVEYNKKNPSTTMPQILLVVDECHEMFRIGSDVPRIVSNEISEIITKIAKEGRSQGVHLIMATQTLSGTEISNEILNNISDHYLLKCATVDSERMVERSSDITSKLSTGQIYYHHVDSQVTFQGYYVDKENAELKIQKIKDKAKGHVSNGEFYFNGSQLFKIDKNVLDSGKQQKYPTAYIGKNISIKQNDLSITLKKDFSENILLFGLNEQEQVTRTTMNVFLSLLYNTKCKGMDMDFKVFNCLSNGESMYTKQLEMLESKGLCEIIEGKKDRGLFLKQLAEDVNNGTSNNTVLLILGQERFRELKMDLDIADDKEQSSNDAFGFGEFSFGSSSSSSSVNTFRKAFETILDKGPEIGVHVVMQLDKPCNFLFSDYISSKLVYQKFKHLIMLKSDEAASSQLGLNDNVRLENLSRDLERLRAYYYAEESDTYTLFTPYMESSKEEIVKLFNL